jgi:pimeloyl-ACP methyl ester carboxylesterase
MTLLRLAAANPGRVRRLVVSGVGRNLFEADEERAKAILAGVEGTGDPEDNIARLFGQYATQEGNDRVALAAVLRRPGPAVFDPAELAAVTIPVLAVIGDRDFAGPVDPLVAALPDARAVVLRNVDHFATPESFGFIDATLDFLGAIPA